MGEQPGPRARRDHARHARPGNRADRAGPGRHADGRSPRGRRGLVERLLPVPGPDEWLAAFQLAQAYLHSLGITAWQDAIVTPDNLAVYRRAAETGLLTARVEAALWWERTQGAEQVDELVERAATGSAGRLRANSVKIALDGVLETFTGAMIDPYLDRDGRPTTNRGIDFVEAEPLREHVARLDAAGLQVHFHAIGDRAVRVALDAIEAAAARQRHDRHPAAHLPHPGHPPRGRAAIRAARRRRERPAAVGLP